MDDGFDDLAIESHAEALIVRAKEDTDFAAAVLLAASRMLAATGNRSQISRSIRIFSDEVWGAAKDVPDAVADADAFLARLSRGGGDADA
ncbi:MAG: hypothetical protein JJU24_08475 [Natronohydrobacter sp.]|nr:hypothetical protein [Natronohydrobacter sp.]